MKYHLLDEAIFGVIESAHVAAEHDDRDCLKVETSRKYVNISTEMINISLSLCETSQKKKNLGKEGLVSKLILYIELNSKCQIDMQYNSDKNFKFLMICQNHLSNFCLLLAMTLNEPKKL